jgi:carboxylate-amine ligase
MDSARADDAASAGRERPAVVPPAAIADHFGAGDALSVGIEDELLLVDKASRRLVHESARYLSTMALPAENVHQELYAAVIELATPVRRDVPSAIAALSELRGSLKAAGASAIGAGVHPMARLGEAPTLEGERYRYGNELLGSVALRTPECALQVHVGMPDAHTAIRTLNGLRVYMPLLEAMAANSPIHAGNDTRFASVRGYMLRRYPRNDLPREFRDFDDYAAALRCVMRAAQVDDCTLVWWQLRLHPRFGTVEVRVMDSQASLWRVGALSAFVHALCAMLGEQRPVSGPPPEALAESSFHAQRFGLDAQLWDGERLRPAREFGAAVLAAVRPYARTLGCAEQLDEVNRIIAEGNGADTQRSILGQAGPDALLDYLVDETMCSTPSVNTVTAGMRRPDRAPVVIIGGGVAGLATAISLRGIGIDARVFERDDRAVPHGAGLSLMSNGLRALERLGVLDAVRAAGVTASRAVILAADGRPIRKKHIPDHVSLTRRALLNVLSDALPDVVVTRGTGLTAFERGPSGRPTAAHFSDGRVVEGSWFVGADGTHSCVRNVMFGHAGTSPVALKELLSLVHAPKLAADLAGTMLKIVHPGGGRSVGIVPVTADSVVWYMTYDASRWDIWCASAEARETFAREHLSDWMAPVPWLLSTTDFATSYLRHTAYSELPQHVTPTNVVLLGDAATTLLPFSTQGANSALEDAVALADRVEGVSGGEALIVALAEFHAGRSARLARYLDYGRRRAANFVDPVRCTEDVPFPSDIHTLVGMTERQAV